MGALFRFLLFGAVFFPPGQQRGLVGIGVNRVTDDEQTGRLHRRSHTPIPAPLLPINPLKKERRGQKARKAFTGAGLRGVLVVQGS